MRILCSLPESFVVNYPLRNTPTRGKFMSYSSFRAYESRSNHGYTPDLEEGEEA
jgi:hypothetical protein